MPDSAILLSAGSNVFRFGYNAVPTLTPGSGSNDSVSSTGTGENAIARWDVVPYQVYAATLRIGVVAFHPGGIARVEFQANGGSIVQTTATTLNTATGVIEYCADLATKASDGVVNVQAVVYPKSGKTRVLTLQLYSNGQGTAKANSVYVATDGNDTTGNGSSGSPYATIMKACKALQTANGTGNADGGTVYLKAGSHVYGTYAFGNLTITQDYWLTIRPAPGLTRDDVILTGSGSSDGLRTKLVKIYDCKITGSIESHGATEDYLWLDGCRLIGAGRTTDSDWLGSGWSGSYWTRCEVSDLRDGINAANIARDCSVHDIGSDAYSGTALVVNCTVYNINSSGTDFHPDIYQMYPSASNQIVYGLTGTQSVLAQGIFAGDNIPVTDVAIVGVVLDTRPEGQYVWQFGGATKNLYARDCSFTGSLGATWMPNFAATNVVIESTVFSAGPGAASGVTFR